MLWSLQERLLNTYQIRLRQIWPHIRTRDQSWVDEIVPLHDEPQLKAGAEEEIMTARA